MTEAVFLAQMGAKIKAARKQAKLSQMKLGELCNLHHSSVSQIECGNADSKLSSLMRIAEVLNKDVKDFL
jgi:transcriptional regulator with XRE-family HTH domain